MRSVILASVGLALPFLGFPVGNAFTTKSAPKLLSRPYDVPFTIRQSSTSDATAVTKSYFKLNMASNVDQEQMKGSSDSLEPQVLATGYSQNMDQAEAIQEATEMALQALPQASEMSKIDLAVVSISSLYDGNFSPSAVVQTFLKAADGYGQGIQHLIGCTCGGWISSLAKSATTTGSRGASTDDITKDGNDDDDEDDNDEKKTARACTPIEQEGVPGVSVLLAILPDVKVKTFHVLGDDVPDDIGRVSSDLWKSSVGLQGLEEPGDGGNSGFFLLPSPAFQNDLDDLLRGFELSFPNSTVFGALASTVSSLSRSRLFRYDSADPDGIQTFAQGCVGASMSGDIEIKTMIAQGAKPVGGIYQIVKGEESTIRAIALDETATELAQAQEGDSEDDEEGDDDPEKQKQEATLKEQMAAAYAKARIPKPVLAEANFLMRTLSDDDQAFMRKAILVGLERGGSVGRTPSELARLAEGRGHRFTVHQVASASMKDGSVTLSLGSVDVEPGTRFRFFVRESGFAKKEVEALWMGYKRRLLTETIEGSSSFIPTGGFLFPTFDRGSKFFLGKPGFESGSVSQYLPGIPCLHGFFCNGVIGALDSDPTAPSMRASPSVHGSASGYVLLGSKSGRPIFLPAKAAADKAQAEEEKALEEAANRRMDAEDKKRQGRMKPSLTLEREAPRDENGELIIKRREVHSGRALTVSTVEWSVAEKAATPSSTLEGYMWDKETEVDRFRERVPLANLVSQCRLASVDPSKPKPRDWVGPVKDAVKTDNKFAIIPECKRVEPASGSLRKRYDLSKLVREFTLAGVPALSVNCDGVLFGGSLEDITKARDAASKAAIQLMSSNDDDGVLVPPILASDLLLYPYQLYKMRLAGADAINLIVGALAGKDLVYLTKIAASLKLQALVTVTSAVQIENLKVVAAGGVDGIIISNRKLENFSFDMTGQQALDILQSDALKDFREKHGSDILVLVEGRVGLIKRKNESALDYIRELKEAGADGAIVGGGLVKDKESPLSPLETLLKQEA